MKELREAYDKAVKDNIKTFIFNGETFSVKQTRKFFMIIGGNDGY